MKNLIDILDLSTAEIDEMIAVANNIIEHPELYREACKYKTLATLFFEPSTRTRLSFEAAMLELGGRVLGFSEASSSSAAKGESVGDTVAVVSGYSDIIAMRHPKEGAPLVAAAKASVPIINAGDGGHNHPTQTLTDLLTIKREKGHFDNLTIGVCGDLKFGRTVHSLIAAMSRYEGIKFVLISPEELKVPSYVKNAYIKNKGMQAGVALNPATPISALENVLPLVDMVLIMTVNPGFGGQKFIPYTLEKVKQVRAMCDAKGLNTDIQVDGGVSAANVREVLEAGANVFVAGSAVFGSEPAARVKEFNEIFKEYEK